MKTFETDKVTPTSVKSQSEKDWIYNGLDTCVTFEVLDALLPQLDPHTSATYDFSRRLQAPVLEMRLRGILIDQARKAEVIELYYEKLDFLERNLERIVCEGAGFYGFNWRSPKQLMELFYDRLGIPVIKRGGRPTVNREALEKMEAYTIAKPIVRHLEAMRDLGKKISMLKTEIDPDGRMRTSYNIGGTSTGRLSSSFSEFGTGTNLQNIEESLRSVFVADPGMKLAYLDAEQGESRVVGAIEYNLFGDSRYLDSCESGDLHTNVARLCWPSLPWANNPKADKALAEQLYYRHYSRRFMCKKIGHGSNYGGKPRTLAAQAKVDVGVIEDFQPKYFTAFPAHLRWHAAVAQQLQQAGYLISLTGRKRWFFGRRNDDATLREAIAYDPQGSLADIVNRGMLQVWRDQRCQLLMQIHDAILVQYPEQDEDDVIPRIQEGLRLPVNLRDGRELVIPYGVKTGWNWGEYSNENQEGLKSYEQGDKRVRSAQVSLLHRRVRRAY
jgi:DNA polymerase I